MALFTVSEARSFTQGGRKPLEQVSAYPNAVIEDAQERIKEDFEKYCRVAFEPTTTTETLDGSGRKVLYLSRPPIISVTSVEIEGVLVDADDYNVKPTGRLKHKSLWPMGDDNLEVEYLHGYPSVPLKIKRAALQVCVFEVVGTDIPQRAVTQQDDFGLIRLAVAGSSTPYGIPEVDSVLNRYRRREHTTLRRVQ